MKKIFFLIFAIMLVSLHQPSSLKAQSNLEYFFKRSSPKYQKVLVSDINKADTLILETGEKIQLIGLSAPKPPEGMDEKFVRNEHGFVMEKKVDDPGTSAAEKSYTFAKELLVGQYVRLEFDVEKNNPDFETIAYVFLWENDLFVNAEILRQGYADLSIRPPNMKYADKLRAAYQEARQEFRGLQGE